MASVPSLSVVVPAYNAEAWIAQTLGSILEQTRPPDEVVVVDDGSTDGTLQAVEPFRDRIKVVTQKNGGAASAYNRGFREATGDYVAKCPADDLWEPQKLEWQLGALAAHPDVDIAFGHAHDFGVQSTESPRPPGEGILDKAALLRALYWQNVIAAPTAVVRRSLHERLGGFREDHVAAEDYDFWLRALLGGALFYYDSRLLARLRKHGGNLSLEPLSVWELTYGIHRRFSDHIPDERLVRQALARDLRALARARLGAGHPREARAAFRESLDYRVTPSAGVAAGILALPGVGRVARRLARWRYGVA